MEETTASYTTEAAQQAATNPMPPWILIMTLVVASAVMLIGVPGNATIVLIYSRKRRLNSAFILILAIVDLIASAITVPSFPFILLGLARPVYAAFWWGTSIFLITLSIWMLNCIAIAYHRAICRPLATKWSDEMIAGIVSTGMAWSLTLGILAWIGLPIMTPMTMWYVIISLALMAVLYSHIVIFLRKRKRITVAPSSSKVPVQDASALSTAASSDCSRAVSHLSHAASNQGSSSTAPPPGPRGTRSASGKSARMLAMVWSLSSDTCYVNMLMFGLLEHPTPVLIQKK
ncbi:hypothetical protein CAPTEDRAFT_189442 [Capitella teleta]|uniref:G-protein coupled receptors family 1 profile domain-containing protein n=1 Tax=Capitella teleta TaxID=283909 RepID=R7VAD9_CAPTE|nr:hypothetical protein CAPTEDRAFT_189442 [Capitella teleta]|eukprot:ELU15579.1 hypothetical protein CAPTEDRAFT_189442 [Capitella teleta]